MLTFFYKPPALNLNPAQAELDELLAELHRLTTERAAVLDEITQARIQWEQDQKVGVRLF